MKPPVAPERTTRAGQPAAFLCLDVIRKRADFVATSHGQRAGAKSLNLQGRNRGDDGPARVGYTATRKVGNAVARNRAKRRMRALAAEVLGPIARPGWDYVLVARPDATANRPWSALKADLLELLDRVHKSSP